MAKKRSQKSKKIKQIDNIPKYSQQPRSPAPKRRTDFSLFFRSSSSPSSSSSSSSNLSNALLNEVSLPESSNGKEILSSVTIANLDDTTTKTKDMSELPMIQCSKSLDNGGKFFSTFVEVPVVEDSKRKGDLSSCRHLFRSPDGANNSNEQDQSSDKWNSSGSSKTNVDFHERRRGNRARKPKVHFDESTFPLSSVRKLRRFRIMRYLGLTAPVGSPFSQPCMM